ncbi:glycosyltransferase family 2 protein [Candidatus Bathyarchaeota archaeon]|nr:glycosyltransferase family 2 protein [Candidatus Bathyarchaeota archaeon]
MKAHPEVSIVIPAYNEADRIETTIYRIFNEIKSFEFEVVVSEDGSTDETPLILKRLKKRFGDRLVTIHNRRRLGKGGGFLRGVEHSRGRYVILLDADYPTDADTIIKIVKYLRMGYDLVIGSRAHELSILDPPPPPLRKVIGRIFNLIVRILFRIRIRDTQCGVKGFRKEVFSIIGPIQFLSFIFDVEMIVKAQIHGLRIKEIPIYWSGKTGSKVRVLRDTVTMLGGLINLWIKLPRYRKISREGMKHSGE